MDADAEAGLLLLIYQSVEAPDQLEAVLSALASLAGATSARVVRTGVQEQAVVAIGHAASWDGGRERPSPTSAPGEVGMRILPLVGDLELILDHADPDPARLRRLVRLAPHLARALRLSEQLAARRGEICLQVEWLDRLPFGVALLDDNKRVLLLNRAAGAMTRPGAPLDLRERHLVPRAEVARALFDALLEQSAKPARKKPRRSTGGRMTLPMLGRVGAELVVAPLRAATARGECACVVLIFSPKLPMRDPESLFVLEHGLFPDEAEVAAELLAGRNPLESEHGIGVSEGRRRLHALFEKLGTTRQADLLRMVLRPLSAAVEEGRTA